MSYQGLLVIGGVDVLNDCRTIQFVSEGRGPEGIMCRDCDPCCSDLRAGLGFPDGWGIADAPWFDGTEASTEFAGLLVQTVDGLAPGEYNRSSELLASNGSAFGRPTQSGPVVTVRALVMASSCEGGDFGIRWLRRLLRSSVGCNGTSANYLVTEPRTPDLDCMIDNGDGTYGVNYDSLTVTYDEADITYDEAGFDFRTWLTPYYRTMQGVVLLNGPSIVETIPRGCPSCHDCGIPVVEFTIAARRPCVYLQGTYLDRFFFDCTPLDPECIVWDESDSCETCGQSLAACATDPNCQAITAPPRLPTISNPCVRDCVSQDVCHTTFDVSPITFPSSSTGTLDISIYSGDTEMRSVKVQIWENTAGLPITQLDECDQRQLRRPEFDAGPLGLERHVPDRVRERGHRAGQPVPWREPGEPGIRLPGAGAGCAVHRPGYGE
jgi:hypothetical protein